MRGDEIRNKFLTYFHNKKHTILPSSSLLPANDPTLLFTNAGMVQFKDIFTGLIKREYPRVTTCQRCIRAGGKHNDLENVGYTARHHTFFEMLGNFSFGDYFKKEAIAFAWEFLTECMNLPKKDLWITIYKDDDEAATLWADVARVQKERIVRLGEKDNFWAMGDVGPCGPCSEIIIDQGPTFSCGKPDCRVGCNCDRYLELWNLVFMQYERHSDGKITPLPRPSIDTGMGLERITATVQGVPTNYDTDLFSDIIHYLEKITGKSYNSQRDFDVFFRVISDHIRAITFLISDGVMPLNEGPGYVLRRIIRRAARCGKQLGLDKPFLHEIVPTMIKSMKDAYPEIADQSAYISSITKLEEERFHTTLTRGLDILHEAIEKSQKVGKNIISGKEIFRLYDTFGFPVDLAQDILRDYGMHFDEGEFSAIMNEQKRRAREHWKGSGEKSIKGIYKEILSHIKNTSFIGYPDQLRKEGIPCSRVMAIIQGEEKKDKAEAGDTVEIILDQTPFYGEKGGQVGDRGTLSATGENPFYGIIMDTQSPLPELIIHHLRIERGSLHVGMQVKGHLDQTRRTNITSNHTATHLLHAALREVLGEQVKQSGSVVAPDRLRFDFSHFAPLSLKQRDEVERIVNEKIRENLCVDTKIMGFEEALSTGAMALFEEKYGATVRLISIGDFSKELCGGTHTHSTGTIGIFLITSESAIAAGVRRIEALTGEGALHYIKSLREERKKISASLKSSEAEIVQRIEKMCGEFKEYVRQNEELHRQVAHLQSTDIINRHRKEIKGKGISYITYHLKKSSIDFNGFRQMADTFLDKMGNKSIVILGTEIQNKAALLVKVSRDISTHIPASEIIKQLASILKGKGGGRTDMAQAGGNYPELIDKALDASHKILTQLFIT
ncbi:MAG: alanine--tRNA ligase [bacterium]